MESIKRIEPVAALAAVVFSAAAAAFGSAEAAASSEFARWVSIGPFVLSPLALLTVSACCAGAYLLGALRDAERQRVPALACSVAVASISAAYVLVSLAGMMAL